VLDDGFQHLRLARDLDLACLDVRDLDERPLPAGRLREGPAALARADLVLLTRLEAASEDELVALEARLGRERTLRVGRRLAGWTPLEDSAAARDAAAEPARAAQAAPPARGFLLAAIARPERFERDVAAAGIAVVGRAFFRDHHRFRERELRAVAEQACRAGAEAILTTAKDAVRLEAAGPGPGRVLGLPVFVARVEALVKDEARLRALVLAAVQRPPRMPGPPLSGDGAA
jgi:tetraacyldisaccharide 4'-kinase